MPTSDTEAGGSEIENETNENVTRKINGQSSADKFREQPRAINFSISNRNRKTNDNNKENESNETKAHKDIPALSQLTPGNDLHYSGRSAAPLSRTQWANSITCTLTVLLLFKLMYGHLVDI